MYVALALASASAEVFQGCTSEEVMAALQGKTLYAALRRGKNLWLQLDAELPGGPVPLLHFGMTGSIKVEGVAAAKYVR